MLIILSGPSGVGKGTVREELFKGNKVNALNMCSFTTDKPVLLVVGGSLGAKKVNDAIRFTTIT